MSPPFDRISRRSLFATGAGAFAGAAAALGRRADASLSHTPALDAKALSPGKPGRDYVPVVTPNGATLPFRIVNGAKVFHLVAEPVRHEFAPGIIGDCWGYNGRTPGPTIEAMEGDRLRIYVTNRLPEPTTVHWHGVLVPNAMDGVAGLSQKAIAPGETFRYEFTLRQHGTHMYHPHFDEMTQMAMGMMGMFVIHPRNPKGPRPDRDFSIMLSEWRIDPGTSRPNPLEMTDFNLLTMNSKAFPGTEPLVAKLGDRVRIRLGNLSAMDHHPIHIHGFQFKIVETDGGQLAQGAQWPDTTALVQVGATRAFEFIADEPGDWAMHCHMTHHVMNQMGHGIPNTLGVKAGDLDEKVQRLLPGYMTMGQDGMGEMGEMGMGVPKNSIPMLGGVGPFGTIDMGGMFTIVKVRPNLTSYEDPGWYDNPPATIARAATDEELRRDGIAAEGGEKQMKDMKGMEDMKGHQGHGPKNVQTSRQPPAAATTYTCPMHPEIVSDKPAKCPKCGMALVPKK